MPPNQHQLSLLLLFIAITLSLSWGCSSPDESREREVASPFFDLKGYFDGEIKRLQQEQPTVRKSVEINGVKEMKELSQLNYEEELEIFLNTDINRTAWWDKYSIDSNLVDGELRSIRYTAQTTDLKVRSLIIDFNHDTPIQIDVEYLSKSPAAYLEQELSYQPQKRYFIKTSQKVTFSQAKEMAVEVIFNN